MTDDHPPTSTLAQHFLKQARAELARVQQNTCGHQVPRTATCTECETSQSNDSQETTDGNV